MFKSGKTENLESGQAITEYILLMAIVASAFLFMTAIFRQQKVADALSKPIQSDYVNAYRFGHPKAEEADGTFKKHPRLGDNGKNGRIFISLGRPNK